MSDQDEEEPEEGVYEEGETLEAYLPVCVPLTYRDGVWQYEGGAYIDIDGAPWMYCGNSDECYSDSRDWFRDEDAMGVADAAIAALLADREAKS